eukprot:NODE_62_length_25126_cov_0.447277.p7 type:complete len:222 gc:universal NODE_62_length_25126_cov_0.447277:6825-7490(+)
MISVLLSVATSQVVYSNCVKKNMVALTLGGGPSENTKSYLKAFKSNNVSATFFVIGTEIEQYPGFVKAIYDDGHSIGGQSYSFADFTKLKDESAIYDEVKKANNLIYKETGKWTNYFRFPYGSYDTKSLKVVQGPTLGMTVVQWDVDSKDWNVPENLREKDSVKNILAPLSKPNKGHILLTSEFENVLLRNIKEIVTKYRAKGYRFVKMHQCLGLDSDYKS